MATVSRFVYVDGRLERQLARVPLSSHPTLPGRWLLGTVGLRIDPYSVHDEDDVASLRHVSSTSRLGRLSHLLATALRSEKLFRRAIRSTGGMPPSPEIALRHEGSYRTSLAIGSGAMYGLFISSPSAARIDFDYLAGGPWVCLSHDVVVHEMLHGMVARYWDWGAAPAFDRWAIEECLADVLAWISAGRHVSLRRWVAKETGGDLSRSNALSRFGGDAPGVPVIRDATDAAAFDRSKMQGTYDVANALSASLLSFVAALTDGTTDLAKDLLPALDVASQCTFGAASRLSGQGVTLPAFAAMLIEEAEQCGAGALMHSSLSKMGFVVLA